MAGDTPRLPGLGPRELPAGLPARDPDLADRRTVLTERPLYGEFAWAYDLLVTPSGIGADWAAAVLSEHGIDTGARVVDAGCGTGRQARALAARGYRVIGIDRSAELIGAAPDTGGAQLVVADLLGWRPPEPVGAVLCRGVLNDLLDDGDRAAALHALAAMLRPGGVLVADVRDRDRSAARYAEPREAVRSAPTERGEVTLRSLMRFEGGLLVADERVELGEVERAYEMRMRPWTADELRGGLRAASFDPVELLPPETAGARDDRIVCVATLSPSARA